MARLGELLVAERLLAQDQVDRALRAQVMWGGRLGTNLIELGLLDIERVSRALGRQHGLPAALARHFEKADRELQQRIPDELARQWSVVPLLHIGPQKSKIAVAAIDPLPREALEQLAAELLCEPEAIVVSVAAEMRVRYHLERIYGIARPPRYLRSRNGSPTPFPQFDNVPVPVDSDVDVAVPIAIDDSAHPTGRAATPDAPPPEPPAPVPPVPPRSPAEVDDIAALIDEAVAHTVGVEPTTPAGQDRRTYLRTLADPAPGPAPMTTRPLGRVALKRVEASAIKPNAASLADAIRAIRRAGHRDRVADLVIDALQRFVPICDAAMLLVVRGDVAISWKSFSRAFAPTVEIAVPLDRPGLVPTVIERNATARAAIGELGAIDAALLRAIRADPTASAAGDSGRDLVVVPLAIADQVVAVIAVATAPNAPVESVQSVAGAAAAAFARLIRDANR